MLLIFANVLFAKARRTTAHILKPCSEKKKCELISCNGILLSNERLKILLYRSMHLTCLLERRI